MAELDSLSIKIEASSKDAASAIDSLIENLKNLNEQLGVVKGNSFSKSMESVVSSANKMQESLKKVENVSYDKAISSMNTLAKSVEDSTSSMSKSIEDAISNANEFGSVVRGMEAGKLEFNEEEYKEAIQGYSEAKDAIDKFKSTLLTVGDIENPIDEVGESAEELPKATSELEKYLSKIREYKDVIRGMESGKVEFNEDIYTEAIRGYDEASSALKELKQSLLDVGDASSKAGVSLKSAFPEASSDIENMLGKLREYKAVVKDMEGGKVAFDKAQYDEAVAGVKTLTQSIKDYKNSLSGSDEGAEGVKNVGAAAEDAAIKVEQLGDALKGLGNIKQVIEGGEIKEFGFSSDVVGNFEKMLPAISDFGKQLPTIIEASKQLPMIVDSTAEVIPTRAMSDIEKMIAKLREYKTVLREMESGKVAFDVEQYDEAVSGIDRLTSAIKEYKNNLVDAGKVTESLPKGLEEISKAEENIEKGPPKVGIAVNLQSLGSELDNLSRKFGEMASSGEKAFKLLTIPLTSSINGIKKKIQSLSSSMDEMSKKFQDDLKRMSQFWNRVMKTFTFMLVRKAIDAVMKSTSDAIQSMAKFSNTMGTQFNKSISLLIADFQYLGRSIVSVFAPLINAVVPIIDAIVDRIATLLSYVGMLMAALTGVTSFTKAKKKVDNYAASLDKASKSAKNLTMGIDELNVLSESGGGAGGGAGGFDDLWEEVEIPDWAKELSDKLKMTAKDLFEPIKKGWDDAKDYVLDGWKYMKDQLKGLLGDIARDFMKVWKSDTVADIFKNLFLIAGDIERVIGNIAKNFRDAWNEGDKGYRILQNLADIADILVQHIRAVTEYMVGWSDSLDFNPLLTSVLNLTGGLEVLADFLGTTFEDVMERVVLKYIKYLIEKGIPNLLNGIDQVISSFDYEKIRADLVNVEVAFEKLLENIDIGRTNAFVNIGKLFAEFANSQLFTDFMQRVADIMDLISAEDVEKVLTGIGKGILSVAEALAKFVASDGFMAFLEVLDKWLDNATSDDIAGVLEKLAIAIGLFRFAEFGTKQAASFMQFMATIGTYATLGQILTQMGEGATVASSGFSIFGGVASKLAIALGTVTIAIGVVVTAMYSITKSFGGVRGVIEDVSKRFERLKKVMEKALNNVGQKNIDKLKEAFDKLKETLGGLKSVWTIVFGAIELGIATISGAIAGFTDSVTGIIEIITGFIELLSGVADIVVGGFSLIVNEFKVLYAYITGDTELLKESAEGFLKSWETVKDGFGKVWKGICDVCSGFIDTLKGIVGAFIDAIVAFFADLKYQLIGDPIVIDMWNEICKVFNKYIGDVIKAIDQFVKDAIKFFDDLAKDPIGKLKELWDGIMADVDDFVIRWKEKLANWWEEHVKPWFTLERWVNIASAIKQGFDGIVTKLKDFIKEWVLKIRSWWEEHVRPWFTLKRWTGLAADIKEGFDAIIKKLEDFVKEWKKKIEAWWNDNVAVWFTKKKWSELANNMKEGLFGGNDNEGKDDGVKGKAKGFLRTLIGGDPELIEGIGKKISGLAEKFSGLKGSLETSVSGMGTTISEWYDNKVKPAFDLTNWTTFGNNIKNGLNTALGNTGELTRTGTKLSQSLIDSIKEGAGCDSPSKKTIQISEWILEGLMIPFQRDITGKFLSYGQKIVDAIKEGVRNADISSIGESLVENLFESINTTNVDVSVSKMFDRIIDSIRTNMNELGTEFSTIFNEFLTDYVAPLFNEENFAVIHEMLYEGVLIPESESFNEWFTESMTTWWEESLITWFAVEKWDKEIIKPLEDLIHERFTLFEKWWTLSMATWWETKVVPWFIYKKWNDKFMVIHKAAEDVFIKVLNTIKIKMSEAEKAVREACQNIKSALSEIISAISEVESKLSSLGSTSGNIKVNIPKFATGGYPTRGSLFIANEAGPELVGRMNGRTAVSSNDEITGIRDAIVDTSNIETELLSRLVMIDQAILDKDVVIIGDRELARIVGEGSSQMGMNIIS